MVALDTSRSLAPRMAYNVVSALFSTFGMLAAWNDARVTRRALSRLSSHELDDIGLTHADIDAIAAGHSVR